MHFIVIKCPFKLTQINQEEVEESLENCSFVHILDHIE